MKSLILWMSLTIASSGLLAQVNCFDIMIEEVIRDPFDENFLVVQLQNPQFEEVSYPGIRVYDAQTDILLGEEVVNFFGIGAESAHLIPIELEVIPSEIYSLKIEIWSNFYENLECSYIEDTTLYPEDFCTDPGFFVAAVSDGITEEFTLEVFSEGELVFNDSFTISQGQSFYSNDSICLTNGCYQAVLGTSDAAISLDGSIFLEAGPYIGVPGLEFQAGDAALQFEFSIFDCGVNNVSNSPNSVALRLFPNPVINQLRILADGGDATKTLSIFDIHGRIVLREVFSSSQSVLEVSNLTAGLYLLSIESDGLVQTQRFVKE